MTVLTAGSNNPFEMKFQGGGNHPGDCSLWISYDEDKTAPRNFIKIKDMPGKAIILKKNVLIIILYMMFNLTSFPH